jgi:hypothetical protein
VASERDDDDDEYDEWDQIIMPVSSDLFLSAMNDDDDDDDNEQVTTTPSRALDEDSSVQSCHEALTSDDDEEEEKMSQSPPPSLPLVVVDLERLCGFLPSTCEEAHELQQQIMEALYRDDDNDNTTTPNKHFEVRVQELFESQMAHHGDSASLKLNMESTINDFSKAILSYPEFTSCRKNHDPSLSSSPTTTTTTARLWKRLLQPHPIAVMNKLLRHLRNCNRPLSWKVDMLHELKLLVKQEEKYHRVASQRQQQEVELEYWKMQGRKQRLDQLYHVRESFALRLEAATDKLKVLKQKWDAATAKELLERLRWTTESATGGLATLDFDTSIFSFGMMKQKRGGEPSLTTSHMDDKDLSCSCHDCGYDSTSPSDDHDDHDDKHLESNIMIGDTTGDDAALLLLPDEVDQKERRSKARQTSAIKTRKCRLQSHQQEEAARIEQAYAEEEERVRELCMTPELKMALATVQSLEERMQQVDDLLESLQEEEWADEENGILQTRAESTASEHHVSSSTPDAPNAKATELSLLDGVLAMILGSLPQSTEISTAEHYKFLHNEHQDIVSEWKEYFGRLPPSPHRVGRVDTVDTATRPVPITEMTRKPVPSNDSDVLARRPPTVEELKKSLGITDNSELDWDDLDDDEAKTSARPPRHKKSAVGLRPGGKAIR